MSTPRSKTVPTMWQSVLAATVGIGIGLFLSYGLPKDSLEGTTLAGSLPKINNITKNFKMPHVDLIPKLAKKKNILLMGVDSNGRKSNRFENCRSDTMVVASLDPIDGKVGLMSIPRDSRVRIPNRDGLEKINSAHALGGPDLAVKTVEEVFGIPIDNYIVIDTTGLKSLFEAIGPVEVLVEKRMVYRDRAARLNIDLEPGKHMLDAHQVEEYLRFRHDQRGDLGRIERQQWFLRQAVAKVKEPAFLLKLPKLLEFAKDYVVTDMGVNELTELFGFGKDIKSQQVETAMLPGDARTVNGGSYWIPDPARAALVISQLTGHSPSVRQIALGTQSKRVALAEAREEPIRDDLDFVEPQAQQQQEYVETSSDSDRASDKLQDALAEAYNDKRPYGVVIRYPKGGEETAKDFQKALESEGFTVRYLVRAKVTDCQHETITLTSFRANKQLAQGLREKFPSMANWALVVNPEYRTRTDLTIQLSPETSPLLPPETVRAEFDYGISDIINGEVKAGKLYNKPSIGLPRS